MAVPMKTTNKGRALVVQWVLDTRNLWPQAVRTVQLTQHVCSHSFWVGEVTDKHRLNAPLLFSQVKNAKMSSSTSTSGTPKWLSAPVYLSDTLFPATPTARGTLRT